MSFWDSIIEVLESNRFNNPNRPPTTLIIGSGVSLYPGGCSSFSSVIGDVIGRKYPVEPEEERREADNEFHEYMRKMENNVEECYQFMQCHLIPAEKGIVYEHIAELAKYGFIHLIMTTNYDCCVENALTKYLESESYQVFELGLRFSQSLDKSYCEWMRNNLPPWDPQVKVIKLYGSFNTRNMAWSRESLIRISDNFLSEQCLTKNILNRMLSGPIIIVGHSLQDEVIIRILSYAANIDASISGKSAHPVFICNRSDNISYNKWLKDKLLQTRSRPEKNHWLFSKSEGEAETFFEKLHKKLVEPRKSVTISEFSLEEDKFVSKETKERYPQGIKSAWSEDNFKDIPFLNKAKNKFLYWNEFVIPFVFIYPDQFNIMYKKKSHFLNHNHIKINRLEGYEFSPKNHRSSPSDVAQTIDDEYKNLIEEEHIRFLRPKGFEWNEDRIRFTSMVESSSGTFVFNAERVKYLQFVASNLLLAKFYIEPRLHAFGNLDVLDLKKKKRAELLMKAINSLSYSEYNDIADWFLDFKKCWLAGAVGTSVLLIDKNWQALLAKRGEDLMHHKGMYQCSSSGTVDYFADMKGPTEIDIFRSAYRELWYESGIRVRMEDLRCLGWGIDATHGHPNFLFLARSKRPFVAHEIGKLFRIESFETDRFALVNLRDRDQVCTFLDSVFMSSNNASLLVLAHERALLFGDSIEEFWHDTF